MRIRKTIPALTLASALAAGGLGLPGTANAQIHLSIGGSDGYGYGSGDVLGAFLTAMLSHFGSNERDVYLIQDRGISEREIPVVLYLARQAGVSPMTIASLRASGYSWSDITYRYGLNSGIYYVPLSSYYGPYASYYQVPRSRWSTLRLSDDAVIGLVNTRFISSYYGAPADRIVRLRSSGRDFTTLAREFHRPERHGQIRPWVRQRALQRREQLAERRENLQQRQVLQQRRERIVERRENLQQRRAVQQRQERRIEQRENLQQRRAMLQQRAQAHRAEAQERRQGNRAEAQERRQERQKAKAAKQQNKKRGHKH